MFALDSATVKTVMRFPNLFNEPSQGNYQNKSTMVKQWDKMFKNDRSSHQTGFRKDKYAYKFGANSFIHSGDMV